MKYFAGLDVSLEETAICVPISATHCRQRPDSAADVYQGRVCPRLLKGRG
jgi:hypothetical protein